MIMNERVSDKACEDVIIKYLMRLFGTMKMNLLRLKLEKIVTN